MKKYLGLKKMSEMYSVCLDIMNGDITGDMAYKIFDDIKIKKYLTLHHKTYLVDSLLRDMDDLDVSTDISDTLADMEIIKFKKIFLEYIELEDDIFIKFNSYMYDVFHISGLYDYIESKIKNELKTIEDMISNGIRLKDLIKTNIMEEGLNFDKNEKALKDLDLLLSDKDKLDGLLKVIDINDPMLLSMKNKILDIKQEDIV